ncbi:hypothetical protein FOA52_010427 [Chlamydomonas sp. UWO 241]|nr:hypothetical protein FOA52_010427 [Chlamydomonas sp. UWO 241]
MDTQTCPHRGSARSALTSPDAEVYSGGGAPHEQKPGGNMQDVLGPEHSKEEECQVRNEDDGFLTVKIKKNTINIKKPLSAFFSRSTHNRVTPTSWDAGPAVNNNALGAAAASRGEHPAHKTGDTGGSAPAVSWPRQEEQHGDEPTSIFFRGFDPSNREKTLASVFYILFLFESLPLKGGWFKNKLSLPGGKAEAGEATAKHTGVREQGEETGGVVASSLGNLQGPTILGGQYAMFEDRCELAVINQAPAKYAAKYKGKTSYESDKPDYMRLTKRIIVDEMVFNGAGWDLIGVHYDDCGVKLEPGWAFKSFLEAYRPQDFDTRRASLVHAGPPRAGRTELPLGTWSAPLPGHTQSPGHEASTSNPFAALSLEDN